jgi:penicillin amidase
MVMPLQLYRTVLKNIFLFCLFFFIRPLHAQENLSIKVKGLVDKVEVLRDRWGVNHIYANNQHDLFFSQGYCAAKDRLFQFEIWRRQATGTVAEILGEHELLRDISTRLFKFRGNMDKELKHYHKNGSEIINAYVDGINAFVDEILSTPEKLPIEFKLLDILPAKWTPEVVISRHQGLLGNIEVELNTAIAVVKAGEQKVKDLLLLMPADPNLKLDAKINGQVLKKEILDVYKASHRSLVFRPEDIETNKNSPNAQGSNNWVVSGKKTATGLPLLANDPHRLVAVPSLRYMVHLVAPGWDVIGGGEPVIPGVSIGHNQHGAWGLTIHNTDVEDLYVYDLNPQNLSQYFYKNAWVTMQELKENIAVKGKQPVSVVLRYTVHGPVTFIDSNNKIGYAIKCAWLEPGASPYLSSLRFDQVKNWRQFRKAASYNFIPAENMIWADKKGNIGWQVVGIAPIRKHFSGLVPIPGNGTHEWSGYLPVKKRPHIYNPAKEYLATANEYVVPPDFKHWNTVGFLWADAYRGQRINEVLSTKNNLNISDMKLLQADYYSIPARDLIVMFREISFNDELTKKAARMLKNWDFVLGKNSIPAGIYAMWEVNINSQADNQILNDSLKPYIDLQLKKIITWLQNPGKNDYFKTVESRNQFLKSTFEKTVDDLKKKLGNNPNDWVYGQEKYKHIEFTNAILKYAGLPATIGPLPRGGNSQTPGSTSNNENQSHGASFKFIADLSNWDNSLMINAPGQSGDFTSPYYNNLFELWATDQYFPAAYSKTKVLEFVKQKSVLLPQ